MLNVKYKRGVRVETNDVVIYVRKNTGYIISVLDKSTNSIKYKTYQKLKNINNTANKYFVNFDFD